MPIIEITDVGFHGLSANPTVHELPPGMWTRAHNIRFNGFAAEKFTGHYQVFGDLVENANPIFLHQTISNAGAVFWLYASQKRIYATDGTTHADVSKYTTVPGDLDYLATLDLNWVGTNFFGIPVLCNGVDVPQYWTGWDIGTPAYCADIPGFASVYNRARVIRAYKNFLVALDMTQGGTRYPYLVAWSTLGAAGSLPTDWNFASATNSAGQFPLADQGGILIDAMPLNDTLMIYKENAIEMMTYVGGAPVMAFRGLSREAGALTRRCIATVKGQHVVLGQGDMYINNGGTVESILDQTDRTRRLRSWFFAQMDQTNFRRSFLVANYRQNEVWACIPEAQRDFPTLALVWNYKENTFGVRDLVASAGVPVPPPMEE